MRNPGSFLAATLLVAGCGVAVCGAQTTAAPVVITSCVSKIYGTARIVSGPNQCIKRLETVVQWNQMGPAGPAGAAGASGPVGPAGATGPTGAQGPAFAVGAASASSGRVVFVPTDGTGASSGLYFVQAMTELATLASASTPYVVVLGAGTYVLPSNPTVPPYVSIRGAGMNATILSGAALTFTDAKGQVEDSFDLADLSIVRGAGGGTATITIPDAGNITFDHVFTDGIAVIDNREPGVAISLSNSIFKYPLTVSAGSTGSHVAILGTEVDVLQSVSGGMSLVCSGVYNATGMLYSNACVAPAAPPSGP